MRKNISLPKNIEDSLSAYRSARKVETGKLLFRETAIVELLRVALAGFEPPVPTADRLAEIELRLEVLEAAASVAAASEGESNG